jgi:hypothetical protein
MVRSDSRDDAAILQPLIRRRHAAWAGELDAALAGVRAAEPGLWDRWTAVRHLEGEFLAELRREREAAEALGAALPPAQRDRLWACGECLELMVRYLHETGGAPDGMRAFQTALEKLDRAFLCWRRELEQALGPLERARVPEAPLASLEAGWGVGSER